MNTDDKARALLKSAREIVLALAELSKSNDDLVDKLALEIIRSWNVGYDAGTKSKQSISNLMK